MLTGRTRWTELTGCHLFKIIKNFTKKHISWDELYRMIKWRYRNFLRVLSVWVYQLLHNVTKYDIIWVHRLVRTNYISRSTVLTAQTWAVRAVRANMRNPIRVVGGGWGLKIVKLDWACIDSDELQVLNKYILYFYHWIFIFQRQSYFWYQWCRPSIGTYNTSHNITSYSIESAILAYCILICSMHINCI